jgi:hypothetical protein
VALTFRAGGSFGDMRRRMAGGDRSEVREPPALRREAMSILGNTMTSAS